MFSKMWINACVLNQELLCTRPTPSTDATVLITLFKNFPKLDSYGDLRELTSPVELDSATDSK